MAVPLAPTGLTVPDLPYGGSVTVSWTFNGTGPQTKYGLRWRLAGTTTWRGEILELAGSASSGAFPPSFMPNGSFEDGVAGWESNTAFGIFTPATFESSTEQASQGTKSLKVMWPTTPGTSGVPDSGSDTSWVDREIFGLTVGDYYLMRTAVLVPTGSSSVLLEAVFRPEQGEVAYETAKDHWVTIARRFRADVTSLYVGVRTLNSRAGMTCYIDEFAVLPVISAGTYDVQVRTANADGWGPWSATASMAALRGNAQLASGGYWIPRQRYTRLGGAWLAKTTRRVP